MGRKREEAKVEGVGATDQTEAGAGAGRREWLQFSSGTCGSFWREEGLRSPGGIWTREEGCGLEIRDGGGGEQRRDGWNPNCTVTEGWGLEEKSSRQRSIQVVGPTEAVGLGRAGRVKGGGVTGERRGDLQGLKGRGKSRGRKQIKGRNPFTFSPGGAATANLDGIPWGDRCAEKVSLPLPHKPPTRTGGVHWSVKIFGHEAQYAAKKGWEGKQDF